MEQQSGRGLPSQSIAIVGIGCRFPGGVNSPQSYWQLLLNQVDAIKEIPQDRFDVNAYYDPRPATPGKIMTRWGGYLDNIDQFDASFFGISPREADRLDPQQRLLLEVGWEAIEDAGEVLGSTNLLNGGAFVGVWLNDYETRLFRDPAKIDFYMTTGSGRYSVAGRLSYFLGMQGPSLTVDTACSSSLVAVHLACQSLRNGECDMALAGGTSVILQPAITIAYSQSRMMAKDGRCKFGDARGDGYVRSEGTALIALKRLEDAIADGNPIYALIQGSAVNNDGRSSGFLTTPGGAGQEDLLRKAYQDAGVSPGQVQYIEAHGTGTRAGDPVEIGAIGAVVKEGRPKGSVCRVGSVKTNFGHAEGAAGVAGLIKVALSLKHHFLPASLHFQTPNPAIPWDELPVRIQAQPEPWPEHEGTALGGVSAFGIAGTNAHIVLTEAPETAVPGAAPGRASGSPYLVPLSARSPVALRDQAAALQAWIHSEKPPSLRDIAYTTSIRRNHHDHRTAITAQSLEDLSQQLADYTEAWDAESVLAVEPAERKILFVFPGQGSQWVGMGRQFMEREPAFRQALQQCSDAIQPLTGWSLVDILCSDAVKERLEQIDFIQPALFAMQVSLGMVWRAYCIEPTAVVGHSMGEVAAAYFAGILSLEDAARVICKRSQLMKTISGKGAMLATNLSYDDALAALSGYENRLSIAVSNSPQSTVLSGDVDALEEMNAALQKKNVFCRPVKVDVAAHSPQMEALRPQLEASLEGLKAHPANVTVYSTVTGKTEAGEYFDVAYWGRNLRQPVLFSTVLQKALADGIDTVIEISPHPVLLQAVEQGFKAANVPSEKVLAALPSSRRDEEDESRVLLKSIGRLYELGHPLDMQKLIPEGGQCVALPTYPWQKEHYWLEIDSPTTALRAGSHPLSGRLVETAALPSAIIREIQIDNTTHPELYAHRLFNTTLLPASAYIELVWAAADEHLGASPLEINDIVFERPLQLQADQKTTLQIVLTPAQENQHTFQIASRSAGSWLRHVTGSLRRGATASDGKPDWSAARQKMQTSQAGKAYYAWLQERGIRLEAPVQVLQTVWTADGEGLAELSEPQVQPILRLDPLFQLIPAALPNTTDGIFLPASIKSITIRGTASGNGLVYARSLIPTDNQDVQQDISLIGPDGLPLIEINGVELQQTGQTALEKTEELLYQLEWQPVERAAQSANTPIQPGNWILLADRSGQAEVLARTLEKAGNRCILFYANPGEALSAAGIRQAIQQLNNQLRGIIYLWSLDQTEPTPESSVNEVESEITHVCLNAVEVVRAISETSMPQPPRMWLVTRGAQLARKEAHPTALMQTGLWGLGRVIAEEHPDLWGGLIDLDPNTDTNTAAAQLAREIMDPEETQLAYDGERRLALRLVRSFPQSDSSAPYHFRSDVSYLITGGMGGIGLEVARWLIQQGARQLILMNRTPLPPRDSWMALKQDHPFYKRVSEVRQLESQGAFVHLAAMDVGDETALRNWLEEYKNEGWPAIRGVLHTAGVVRDKLVTQMNQEDWDAVVRPKVRGGWLLQQLLPDLELFILFSSIGSLFGPTGQGNYATANAFLDGLASYRRGSGLPATSVNWGFWNDIGLARSSGSLQTQHSMEKQGFSAFNATQGIDALAKILANAPTQIAVMGARWEQVRTTRLSKHHIDLLKALLASSDTVETSDVDEQAKTGASLRETLLALPTEQRTMHLATYLQGQVSQVLKMPPSRIPLTKPLGPLGLDSLMAIELRGQLESALGISLSATFVWSYPTLMQMAPFIAGRIDVPLEAEKPAVSVAAVTPDNPQPTLDTFETLVDDLLSGIEGLSDESAQDTLLNE